MSAACGSCVFAKRNNQKSMITHTKLKRVGPVERNQRLQNARLFEEDQLAQAQYVNTPDDPEAKCYEIVQNDDDDPIGFIWIACCPDEDIPEHMNVHVEYVFIVDAKRGDNARWLANAVVEELRSTLISLGEKSPPITIVNSTTQPVTPQGAKFVLRLNDALNSFSQNNGLKFHCDNEYAPDSDARIV